MYTLITLVCIIYTNRLTPFNMATALIPSDWVYSNETLNGARLSTLLINEGTQAIRRILDNKITPGDLQSVLNKTRNKRTFTK